MTMNIKFSKTLVIIGTVFVCYIIGSIVYFAYLRTTIIFQETQLSRLLKATSSNNDVLFSERENLSNDQINYQVTNFINEISTMRDEITSLRDELNTQKEKQNNEIIFDIVRNSIDPDTNLTYSEYIQRNTQRNSNNRQYNWTLEERSKDIFLVSLVTGSDGGLFWEVNSNTRTAKLINGDYFLEKKYGMKPIYIDKFFAIENITSEEVYLRGKKMLLFFSEDGIEYSIKGSIKNNTGLNITNCSLEVKFIVVYSDNKIFSLSEREVVFDKPTMSNPWLPNRARNFTITTEYINAGYKNYDPIEALVYIRINAENVMGAKYNGVIANRNIIKLFEEIN